MKQLRTFIRLLEQASVETLMFLAFLLVAPFVFLWSAIVRRPIGVQVSHDPLEVRLYYSEPGE